MRRWASSAARCRVSALFPRLGTNFVLEALTRFFLGAGLVVAGYGVLGAVGAISASVIVACFIPANPSTIASSGRHGGAASYAEAIQAIVFFMARSSSTMSISCWSSISSLGSRRRLCRDFTDWALLYFASLVRRGQRNVSCGCGCQSGAEKKPMALASPAPGAWSFAGLHCGAALFPHLIMGVIFGSRFIEIGWLLALYAAATGCIR